MTGVRKSQKRTNSDATAEALSAQSCYTVLETSPPDYVEKISRYLESSVGQSRHDKESNDPAEAESDSGDSLFITQKPVPEAVRSGRRRHCSQRSDPSSTRYLEEGEDDSSSSSSHEESKTDKRSRTQKVKLPKYSFPFLTDRKWKSKSTLLSVPQNTALHNSAMGGFFKCVRELWQGYQRGEGVQASLPTVDRDGELISPLSEEEEEERPESDDIKVVERKRFAVPSKSMRSQTWYTPERRDSQVKQQRTRRRTTGNAGQEMSRGRQKKTQHKIPAKAATSKPTALPSQSSANGDPSHKVLAERETSDEHVTNDRSILTQTETPKTKRRLTKRSKKILSQEKEMEEELHNDSDATFCETLELQGSSGECTLKDREASPNVTKPQADVFHTDDQSLTGQAEDEPESQSLLQSLPNLVSGTNNDRMHNETRVKKKTKGGCESVTEGKDQSLEEPEGLRAAASANVEREETPSLSEDNRAEPPASQPGQEPEPNKENWMENSNPDITLRQEERHIPDFKQIKKKKKLAADTVGQEKEEEGNLESHVRPEKDPLFSVTCKEVNSGGEKKKKRRNRSVEDDEGEEQLQSTVISEPPNDDAETQRKKKKRKKEKEIVKMEEHEEEEASDLPLMSEGQFEEMGLNCLENTEAAEETLESGYEKKRKKHKKKKLSASHDDAQVGAEDDVDLILSNDGTLEGRTGLSVKKKKKKKKNRESISEEVDISCSPDKDKMNSVDNSQKTEEEPDDPHAEVLTKKKKKKSKTSSRNVSEDTVTQSDDSVSVRKKEKNRTSSFLVADAEEKDAQTHEEQSSPCLESVAARVWGTEKPGVRAGDLQTESAELAGHLEACDDGVRKEKRKRKMSVVQESVEKDHEWDFETCQGALSETADTGVKRKKKHKRNESESVMPTERLESADDAGGSQTDEAVVVKKKKKKRKGKSCHVTPESPPAATDGVEQLAFPLVAEEIPHDSDTSDKATKETLNMAAHSSPPSDTPGKSVLNNQRDGKRKEKIKSTANVLHKRKLLTEFAETETYKTKKEKRNQPTTPSSTVFSETSPSQFKTSFSDSIVKNKHKMAKRRLHNPSEDFLIDDV
ncbi:phoenix [Toxotes jaculatrix]|uniref:phoenix n=1 Tax=Toxotes jaculatrix TaxID=941984 RepID=UPI001B3AF890|nr:phoenix [Toxotes jaculatrix]